MDADGGLLFLDFDGVVCDSIEECFFSSAEAYYARELRRAVPAFDEAYRKAYRAQRPFVRNGEDYLLIHGILSSGGRCATQAEFDAIRLKAGRPLLARYLELFTAARRDLLVADRARWLSLNPVYPFMLDLLPRLGANGRSYILSTKKREFIVEILASRGSGWEEERIVSVQDRPKLQLVSGILDETGGSRATFVDDQIEHLAGPADPRVRRYLALWGYAYPGARSDGVGELGEAEAKALIEEFLGRG